MALYERFWFARFYKFLRYSTVIMINDYYYYYYFFEIKFETNYKYISLKLKMLDKELTLEFICRFSYQE